MREVAESGRRDSCLPWVLNPNVKPGSLPNISLASGQSAGLVTRTAVFY